MPVNDCENNCTLKTRVDRLEKDFEAEKETNSQRHAEFYARIGKLEQVQAVSGTRLDTIMDKLDSIALDLTALKEKPSKRWGDSCGGSHYGCGGLSVGGHWAALRRRQYAEQSLAVDTGFPQLTEEQSAEEKV